MSALVDRLPTDAADLYRRSAEVVGPVRLELLRAAQDLIDTAEPGGLGLWSELQCEISAEIEVTPPDSEGPR